MYNTVVEYIWHNARELPNKLAITDKYSHTTYEELWNYILGFQTYLKKTGLQKGDFVIMQASQTLAYAVAYFGTHLAGGIFAPIEKMSSVDVLRNLNRQLHAAFLICKPELYFNEYQGHYIESDAILQLAAENYSENTAFTFPEPDSSSEILFTTGTTGASKCVELSHKSIVAVAHNIIYGCEMKKDTIILVPGPLNHANPIRKLFTAMVNGSGIVLLDGMISIKAFFDALDNEHVNAMCLPPAAIRTIFQLSKNKLGEYADQIDFIESATSPLPEPDKERLCKLLPKTRLYNNYGSSESGSVCMYDYNRYRGLTGCIGKAMPNSEIFISDENGNAIKATKENPGFIACKGPVNMKGYLNDPVTTAQVLRNGIVYTNDLGYIDDQGFIYIVGRKGDVINVGGRKVAPAEVEEKALAYPGISDCICVPVQDKITGMAVKLLVVLGEKPQDFQAAALREFLSQSLENYKVPKSIEIIDQVPRTYNGKIDRKKFSIT